MIATIYTFDNSAAAAAEQLDSLEAFLDPVTTRRITEMQLRVGARCWEIGAGGGSIAAWLSDHVGPDGHVTATDVNTTHLGHLNDRTNVTVVEHDVTTLTSPPGGPFDLIHARLVLLHLPRREQILTRLADNLAPGGWLLLEEFDCTQPLNIYTTRSEADTDLFHRVTDTIVDILERNGADMYWAHVVHPVMKDAGLTGVHTVTYSESWEGGSPGTQSHIANSRQLATQLGEAGIANGELEEFRDVVSDTAHAAASYLFVSTRGQRPLA